MAYGNERAELQQCAVMCGDNFRGVSLNCPVESTWAFRGGSTPVARFHVGEMTVGETERDTLNVEEQHIILNSRKFFSVYDVCMHIYMQTSIDPVFTQELNSSSSRSSVEVRQRVMLEENNSKTPSNSTSDWKRQQVQWGLRYRRTSPVCESTRRFVMNVVDAKESTKNS